MEKNIDQMGSSNPAEVEPYVKITLSPNTPSPEPREEDQHDTNEEFSVEEKQQEAAETCGASGQSHAFSDPENHWKTFKDIPVCVDFGIQDYLCRGHEVC